MVEPQRYTREGEPSAGTLRLYERDGAVLVRSAVNDAWIGALRRASERALAGHAAYDEDYGSPREPGRFFETTYLWRRYSEFRNFALHSPAASIAKHVMGSSTATLFYDQLFIKEPGTAKRTPWHQDKPYWALQGSQMCSIWLALDTIAADNCVAFVAGSHRWGEYRAYHFVDQSPYRGQEDLQAMPEKPGNSDTSILAWDLSPGDCIIFDPLVIHGAPGNTSHTSRRRAVVTRWIGDDVTYCGGSREFAFPKDGYGLRDGERLPENLALQID